MCRPIGELGQASVTSAPARISRSRGCETSAIPGAASTAPANATRPLPGWPGCASVPRGQIEQTFDLFSGGNQQKIVLAKWLRTRPRVILVDEPTQGVDAGAQAEIHELLVKAAQDGAAVVVASSDTKELAQICDRVLVMREGVVGAELSGDGHQRVRSHLRHHRRVLRSQQGQTRHASAAWATRMAVNVLRALSFRNASAIWVMVVIVLVFSYTIPETFLAARTWTSLLDTQAIVAITAVALVLPLSAGVFNLAIGAQVGVASIMIGWLLVPVGLPIFVALLVTLLSSAAIGFLIAVLIVGFQIDSFIATLGGEFAPVRPRHLHFRRPADSQDAARFHRLRDRQDLRAHLSVPRDARAWGGRLVRARAHAAWKADLRHRRQSRSCAVVRSACRRHHPRHDDGVRASHRRRGHLDDVAPRQCRSYHRARLHVARLYRRFSRLNAIPSRPVQRREAPYCRSMCWRRASRGSNCPACRHGSPTASTEPRFWPPWGLHRRRATRRPGHYGGDSFARDAQTRRSRPRAPGRQGPDDMERTMKPNDSQTRRASAVAGIEETCACA